MKLIRDVTENEMVAVFLQAEINSARWGESIQALLTRNEKNRNIIDTPDLASELENSYRKQLLGEFRGYVQDKHLFETFPNDVTWQLVHLSKQELEKVKYMNYDYWTKLANGTRLAKVGAESVKNRAEVFDVSNEGFLKAANAIKDGVEFPHMIFVAKDFNSDIVVLEGHQRITAYFLVPESIENGLDVILGISGNMPQWCSY